MTVKQTATGWAVVDGDRTLAEFPTQGAAWRWIDRQERRHGSANQAWAGAGVYYDVEQP